MITPSPLLPQGAIPPRAKSSLYFKVLMILSVHVVVIGGMLLQGCKDTSKDPAKDAVPVTTDTSAPSTAPLATAPAPANTMDPAPTANPALANTTVETPVATPVPAPVPVTQSATAMVPPAKSTDLAPAPASGDAKDYAIAKGDTLGAIARKNGLSVKALIEANPGINPKKLRIGQKVQIPAAVAATATKDAVAGAEVVAADGAVYVVKQGDMLLKIAKAHGTTVKKIMAMNELKSTSIRVGQKLKVPGAKTSSTEPAAASMPESAPMRVSAAVSAPGTPVAAN